MTPLKESFVAEIREQGEQRGFALERGTGNRRWDFCLKRDDRTINGVVRASMRSPGPWFHLSEPEGLCPGGTRPFQCVYDGDQHHRIFIPFSVARRYSWTHGTRRKSFELRREGARYRIHVSADSRFLDEFVDDWEALFRDVDRNTAGDAP